MYRNGPSKQILRNCNATFTGKALESFSKKERRVGRDAPHSGDAYALVGERNVEMVKDMLNAATETRDLAVIQAKICTIHEVPVMIDRDLAEMYQVELRVFNQAVRRNLNRFPANFMFEVDKDEILPLITNCDLLAKARYWPQRSMVFTEQGVAMLSAVLRSDIAVETSIRIINAFVAMRKAMSAIAPALVSITARLEANERRQITDQSRNEARFDAIFEKMSEGSLPDHQIFYQGQFWDAKSLLIKFIRRAKKELIVVDAYLGTATLDILAKRTRGVKIELIAHSNGDLAESDFEAFGRQYGKLKKSICGICHDRFIIVDQKEIYAVGASLKDAGRLTFAVIRSGTETIPGLLANLRKATKETRTYG